MNLSLQEEQRKKKPHRTAGWLNYDGSTGLVYVLRGQRLLISAIGTFALKLIHDVGERNLPKKSHLRYFLELCISIFQNTVWNPPNILLLVHSFISPFEAHVATVLFAKFPRSYTKGVLQNIEAATF